MHMDVVTVISGTVYWYVRAHRGTEGAGHLQSPHYGQVLYRLGCVAVIQCNSNELLSNREASAMYISRIIRTCHNGMYL